MKWWGWGDPGKVFPAEEKMALWPWSMRTLGIEKEVYEPPIERALIRLEPPSIPPDFVAALEGIELSSSEDDRLLHSYGKSYPDLVKVRRGEVLCPPDVILYPRTNHEVERIVRAALENEISLIPFGGGTNIVGGVNPLPGPRPVASVDLSRMNQLVALDRVSFTATIQAGARGPEIEAQLNAEGFSLGHYPDSFEFSTLGGWIATRSAGMQSDAYGRIEDMIVALKLVTPQGVLETREVPASSAGPDLNRIVAGSEGTLGIITEATVRVHRAPTVKDLRGFLFRSFEEGMKAIFEIVRAGYPPTLMRLHDEKETELAFVMKTPKPGLRAKARAIVKRYLKARGYGTPALLIIGFEGDRRAVKQTRRVAFRVLRAHHAFALGRRVGEAWSRDKYDMPYLRDFILDYGCMVDVAETSATWANVLPLYKKTMATIGAKFSSDGLLGYAGCHISHTYATGACLYFTYATKAPKGRELEHYYSYKRLFTECFLRNGGALTHHHAVGTEHLPWLARELSPAGMKALGALKTSLDPKGIFNPGKLVAAPTKVAPPACYRDSEALEPPPPG